MVHLEVTHITEDVFLPGRVRAVIYVPEANGVVGGTSQKRSSWQTSSLIFKLRIHLQFPNNKAKGNSLQPLQ